MSILRHARALALLGAVATAVPSSVIAQPVTTTAAEKPATAGFDFSGLAFGSLSYRSDSATKLANGGKDRPQFNLDRVYFTFRMPAGEDVSIRATTDVFQQSPSTYYAGWAIRMKYAYVQYNFLHDIGGNKGFNAQARVGLLHHVSIDHYETFWPRYLEQTDIERNGFASSSDLGAALTLTLPNKWGEIYTTIVNGTGYTSGEVDRFKDYAFRLSLTPFAGMEGNGLFKTFTISPWASTGASASGHQNDVASVTNNGPVPDGLNKDRFGVLVGNKDRALTFAVNWSQRKESLESGANTVASPLVKADTSGTVTSGFVVLRPAELLDRSEKSRWGVIVRYDNFVPKDNSVAGTGGAAPSQQRTIAGLFWEPNARTTLTLDYQGLDYSNYTPAAKPAVQSTVFLHWYVTF